MEKDLQLPLQKEDALSLRAGDTARLSGTLYTARDAAHARLCVMIESGEALPVALDGQTLYYTGPCPAPPGWAVGPCGPTTAGRMDAFTPQMIAQGVVAIIAKGFRSDAVKQAMRQNHVVYFAAIGGAGALLAKHVTQCECVAFGDLGTEAIYRFTVREFPVTVVYDAHGGDLYAEGPARYRRA